VPGPSLGADKLSYIYLGGHENEISVYAPGSKTASRFISANVEGFYTRMLVTPNGWPTYDNNEMFGLAPGASAPTNPFTRAA
jgi:hypothetical protein